MFIRPASDRSLFVSFSDAISPEAHRQVVALTHCLTGVRGILNLHPAFTSVLIDFDPRLHTHEQIESIARDRLATAEALSPETPRTVEIPARFGGDEGPDLDDVARHTNLPADRVLELFLDTEFEVYFVGFSTCFPYLAGLPAELATPRRASPRKAVPEGSVAIGGAQAGVYPLSSPGGWRLIGRTALKLFEPTATPPPLLRMGDRVRFMAL